MGSLDLDRSPQNQCQILSYIRRPSLLNSSGKIPIILVDGDENATPLDPKLAAKISRQKFQYFAALAANLGGASLGTVIAWSATALPDLRTSEKFKISSIEEICIASIALLGATVACPIFGLGIERIGRKGTMMWIAIPFAAFWFMTGLAKNIEMVYIGRFMTGFFTGAYSIAGPMYITEVSDPKIRGTLTAGFDLMITVGILYINVLGSYLGWELQAMVCAIFPLLSGLLIFFCPESPIYLLEKGDHEGTMKAISWFHGETPAAAQEKSSSKDCSNSPNTQVEVTSAPEVANNDGGKSCRSKVLTRSVLKSTSIGVILMCFRHLSGIDPVLFYTVDIFRTSGSDINANLSTIIFGGIQVIATIVAALLVDKCGRRPLLLLSAAFMALSLGGLGLFLFMKENNEGQAPVHFLWVPLVSLIIFVVAFSIGFGPIPWLTMGEILPLHIRGWASGLITVTRWILGFVMAMSFGRLIELLGESGAYWFFALMCILGFVYVLIFVPETKGKTLKEIQDSL